MSYWRSIIEKNNEKNLNIHILCHLKNIYMITFSILNLIFSFTGYFIHSNGRIFTPAFRPGQMEMSWKLIKWDSRFILQHLHICLTFILKVSKIKFIRSVCHWLVLSALSFYEWSKTCEIIHKPIWHCLLESEITSQ